MLTTPPDSQKSVEQRYTFQPDFRNIQLSKAYSNTNIVTTTIGFLLILIINTFFITVFLYHLEIDKLLSSIL